MRHPGQFLLDPTLARAVSSGSANDATRANAVTVDAAGDVIAGGGLDPTGTRREFGVIKFDGGTGAELWRQSFPGTGPPYQPSQVRTVTADAAGDVLAAGGLNNLAVSTEFVVAKFASANGMELWRQQRVLSPALAVATDGAGDVIVGNGAAVIKFAGGSGAEIWRDDDIVGAALAVYPSNDIVTIGTGQFVVKRLAGATGAQQWRTVVDFGGAFAVAIDGAGDVLAAGEVSFGPNGNDMLVVKLAGATGLELWRRVIAGDGESLDRAVAVAATGGGDVVVAGYVFNRNTEDDWRVMRLAGGTGADVWTHEIGGTEAFSADRPAALALDSGDNAIVAGVINSGKSHADIAVLKLDAATGAELWRQTIDGTAHGSDDGAGVAVTGADDVVAAGFLFNADGGLGVDLTAMKLGALDGAVGPVGGRRLVVVDRAGDPAARRVSAVVADGSIKISPFGSPGDPTVNGGSITLQNPVTLESATFPLPAGSWRALGTPPGRRGYKYADTAGANGPCKAVLAKPGTLRFTCLGRLGAIPFSLDETTQGALTVSVQLGASEGQCARFGGDVRRDAGTANPGPSGIFSASDAAPFAGDCP